MKLEGITIKGKSIWKIHTGYEMGSVFEAIPGLVPPGSILYTESGFLEDEVGDFLNSKNITDTTKIYPGTIAPKRTVFRIPVTQQNLHDLAKISNKYSEMEVLNHFVVYKDNNVLITAYDFMDSSLNLSEVFSEDEVRDFSQKIGCNYSLRENI